MARTPDKRVAANRKRAVELEKQGFSAAEIAKMIGGISASTVRRWLRQERGTIVYKERVIELLHEGLSFDEIAVQVGCSQEYVRKLERKIRHALEADYTKSRKRLTRYLADPEKEKRADYTLYDSFGRDLVGHCNHLVDTDPRNAKDILEVAVCQFEILMERLRLPERIQQAKCNLAQVMAADAARDRALGRPQVGLLKLKQTGQDSQGCVPCLADLTRRESTMLTELGLNEESKRKSNRWYREALSKVEESKRLYAEMGHSGHDGDNNGPANCALVEASLYYYMKKPSKAVRVAEHALYFYVTPDDKSLFLFLRFLRANGLMSLESAQKRELAAEISTQLYQEMCNSPSSVTRMRVAWLAGRAAAIIGEAEIARLRIEDALQDAQFLELPEFTASILADVEGLTPNPTTLKGRIDRLKSHDEKSHDEKNTSFPPWLDSMEDLLVAASERAATIFLRHFATFGWAAEATRSL